MQAAKRKVAPLLRELTKTAAECGTHPPRSEQRLGEDTVVPAGKSLVA